MSEIVEICKIASDVIENNLLSDKYNDEEIEEMKKFIKFAIKTNLRLIDCGETGRQFCNTDKNGEDWILR